MSRNTRIARILKLAERMARSRHGIVVARYAAAEGVPVRSVYRDLDALNQAGFPVVPDGGRYRLLDNWMPAAQLGVSADELLALHLARQQAAGWEGTLLADALQRLYGKLATPRGGTGKLVPAGLGGGFSLVPPAARDYAGFRNTVAVLDRACREHVVVDASYESVDGAITQRAIEPAQLHWDPRLETLYLIAWCRLREDVRVFATHRFRVVSPRREGFAPRADLSSQTALKHAFRVWRADRVVAVECRFTGRAARLVEERRWHPSQKTRRDGDGLIFTVEVAGLQEITPWILSFGPECAVLAPAELRERVREAHLRAAGGPARRRRQAS
jgi:predicted DNA-binding transcriptional regulator YafY